MVTMAQRIEQLRTEKGLSRPALSLALGLPKNAAEKFETGRATPTKEQQDKIARYFEVSLFYLKGETDDRTSQENWMAGNFGVVDDEPVPPIVSAVAKKVKPAVQSSGGNTGVFEAFRNNKAFQDMIRDTVLDVLRSPEGQEILTRVIKKELKK